MEWQNPKLFLTTTKLEGSDMEKIKFKQIVIIFLILIMTNSMAFSATQRKVNFLDKTVQRQMAKIPRISAQQAYALFRQNRIVLVDTHWTRKHIDQVNIREHLKKFPSPIVGALTIPYPLVPRVRLKIPKNKMIACF